MMGVPVAAIGHYGDMVGVSDYYVNGSRIGSASGWGGGGAVSCCVMVPKNPMQPFSINVKWVTCDIRHIKYVNGLAVDPNRRCKEEVHEAAIPVNFAVTPDDSEGMYLHFLPGHRVEAWVSRVSPNSSKYPGPAYPRGVPPIYSPPEYPSK
ncbi:DUF3304 domain-containing protein [Comamonas composti]|uniref:DUF3304 domain-containing protein n=1 Tax=Comamonas composti TaxID=408558 RepID=UPI00387E1C4C